MFAKAAEGIGGLDRLIAWIKESPQNEFAFWTTVYPRLLPLHIRGPGPQGELTVEIKSDELSRRLEERGLPVTIFGRDAPVLELQANKDGGNGQDRSEGGGPAGVAGNGQGNGQDQE